MSLVRKIGVITHSSAVVCGSPHPPRGHYCARALCTSFPRARRSARRGNNPNEIKRLVAVRE